MNNKKCDNCKKVIKNAEFGFSDFRFQTLSSIYYLCYECTDELTFECEDCNRNTLRTYHREVLDRNVCVSCMNDNYRNCESCNAVMYYEDTYNCEDCDFGPYCMGCYEEHTCPADFEQYQELVFKKGRSCKTVKNDSRFVAVELEAEYGNRNELELPSEFAIKEDGSLRDSGVEVNTSPATGTEVVKQVKLACSRLKEANYNISRRCGMHTHIDFRDKVRDYTFLSHLTTTFYSIEDMLFAINPPSRLGNSYCKPLRSKFDFYDFFGKDRIKLFTRTYKSKTGDRYQALNFYALDEHQTAEIRLHAGTLSPIKILRWIDLLTHIVDWTEKSYNQKQVENLLKMKADKNKIEAMGNVFDLPKPVKSYMKARMDQFYPNGLQLNYRLGVK